MQITPPQPCRPAIPLTDARFAYQKSDKTNVQQTWARFGWTPPAKHGGCND